MVEILSLHTCRDKLKPIKKAATHQKQVISDKATPFKPFTHLFQP
jgi:hypothetical protein